MPDTSALTGCSGMRIATMVSTAPMIRLSNIISMMDRVALSSPSGIRIPKRVARYSKTPASSTVSSRTRKTMPAKKIVSVRR